MIWIIASLPLWIASVYSGALGMTGLLSAINEGAKGEDAWIAYKGFLILMLIAAALTYLAARMCA